jgi:hypothetical protein
MNVAQRIVLLVGFLVLLIAVLFPPWLFIYKHPELSAIERPAGYHLIFGQDVPLDRTELSKRPRPARGSGITAVCKRSH